ncbi:hypothetical protein Tco_0241386 [Tanacetum coccineum]
MSAITEIKCVLSQKAFDAFCEKFHILEEVLPVLPGRGDTMHERPARKIGLYTRFFDFANFRLPLSTFFVVILRHFCINISQLSVIGAAKVSHFEILCRVYGIIPTVGLFRCFYVNSKKNGWMSFSKRSDNAPGYESLLLETTASRTIPLLPVAPDRAESKLEASVDMLFDEGGSGNQTEQGDSAGGRQGADIQPVNEAAGTVVENVAPVQPKRQRKRKIVVVDAGESSHPPKRLTEDHRTPSRASVGGKSRSAVQRLLAGAVLNAEVRGGAIPTLPFVTSSVFVMPEREDGDHTDFVAEPNLRTISAPQRFVISSDSSHHFGANVVEAEVDSLVRSSIPTMIVATTVTLTVDPASIAKKKDVEPSSLFAGSSSASRTDPATGGFTDLTGSDFLVGGIRTIIDPKSDLQKIYVP